MSSTPYTKFYRTHTSGTCIHTGKLRNNHKIIMKNSGKKVALFDKNYLARQLTHVDITNTHGFAYSNINKEKSKFSNEYFNILLL